MNKLNLDCLSKLTDQLSYEDTIKFEESIGVKIWILNNSHKFYVIRARNIDDVIKKMILKGLPFHRYLTSEASQSCPTCLEYNKRHDYQFMGTWVDPDWKDDQSMINIIIDRHCMLCDSNNCEHQSKKLFCLERSKLSNEELIKITKNMIKQKSYKIHEFDFNKDKSFYQFNVNVYD